MNWIAVVSFGDNNLRHAQGLSRETRMQLAGFFLWACAIAGLSCDSVPKAAIPNATIIQTAYEQEAPNSGIRHDKGLRIVDASCDNGVNGRYLCQVSFLSEDDPDQRLYFDIVSAAKTDQGWTLTSGLCKR
jgi:hypothetical protein